MAWQPSTDRDTADRQAPPNLENGSRVKTNRMQATLFAMGDYLAGGITGGATAVAVRALVDPDLDMVIVMLVGMAIGMVVHLALALVLSPILGALHVMVPGSLIGMYGGMLFAMRDTMQHPSGTTSHAILVGVAFGLIVTAGVHLYDRVLHGPAPVSRLV